MGERFHRKLKLSLYFSGKYQAARLLPSCQEATAQHFIYSGSSELWQGDFPRQVGAESESSLIRNTCSQSKWSAGSGDSSARLRLELPFMNPHRIISAVSYRCLWAHISALLPSHFHRNKLQDCICARELCPLILFTNFFKGIVINMLCRQLSFDSVVGVTVTSRLNYTGSYWMSWRESFPEILSLSCLRPKTWRTDSDCCLL